MMIKRVKVEPSPLAEVIPLFLNRLREESKKEYRKPVFHDSYKPPKNHWFVVSFNGEGKVRHTKIMDASFWPAVLFLKDYGYHVHVLRSDGLLYRSYVKYGNFVRLYDFRLTQFDEREIKALWRILKQYHLRQYEKKPSHA